MNKAIIPTAALAVALNAGCAPGPDSSSGSQICLLVEAGDITTTFCTEADPRSLKKPCAKQVLREPGDPLAHMLPANMVATGEVDCNAARALDQRFWSCLNEMGVSPDSTAVITVQGLNGDPAPQTLFMGTVAEARALSNGGMMRTCPNF